VYDGAPAPQPALPALLTAERAELPGSASIPPAVLPAPAEGGSAKAGDSSEPQLIQDVLPGYQDVRLMAPQAELRMLACGLSVMINADCLT
jgi:hypothetical protein